MRTISLLRLLLVVGTALLVASPASADRSSPFPAVIDLPAGFQPEGIEIGPGATFYVGSLVDGAVYRGSLQTGRGDVLVPGTAGTAAFGLELDRRGRLFVAGGAGGGARVLDASTGEEIASYRFTPPGTGLVHDVHVTRNAAFFTDSLQPVLYRLPIGKRGQLGRQDSVETIPLSGELEYEEEGPACPAAPELNVTGIESSPDGRRLIVAQLNSGTLFSVDPATGVAEAIDVGAVLDCSNGLVRRGRVLYVAQPPANQVAAVRLGASHTAATLIGPITGPGLDFPTATAVFGPWLYTANARFDTPPTPETRYRVVRLPAHLGYGDR